MSKFQIIILSIFTVFIIAGVIAFATFKGQSGSANLPAITIWGTFPQSVFDEYLSKVNQTSSQQISVTYVEKSPQEFSRDFTTAVARGQGPDAILVPADILLPQEDKLTLIPYTALSERTFLDSYVQEASIYLEQNGIVAIPFMIDPLVMYWNRDTFDAAGIATRPVYWEEFADLNKKLTVKDSKGTIKKSAIALGEFGNINNARELLGTLIMQLGNPITGRTADGEVVSALKNPSLPSPIEALNFFTAAVNPSSSAYSWNRSMPDSRTAFLSGMLATYFGFASELGDLRAKNPNINFDVAPIPQVKNSQQKVTYGRMYGFSIVRTSALAASTYQIISILASPQSLSQLSQSLYLPSVNRLVIAQGTTDPYISMFNQAALISRTWLDVDPSQSFTLFSNLVNRVTSGERTAEQAIADTSDQYDIILHDILQ